MSRNSFTTIRDIVLHEFAHIVPDLSAALQARIDVSPTRDAAHGDMATNAAMIAAKSVGRPPQALATELAARLAAHGGPIAAAAPAGPGFVNITLAPSFLLHQLPLILAAGTAYGDGPPAASGPVNVEYVSTNPTGPVHVGHCRGAVVGDALANLLAKAGFDVTKEYYINDAGGQVVALARAAYARYLDALGLTAHAAAYRAGVPGGIQYGGDYLAPLGHDLAADYGGSFVDQPEDVWLETFRTRAVEAMMALVVEDLALLGVRHDVFSSERKLVEAGAVERVLAELAAHDLIYSGTLAPPKGKAPDDYEAREQTLFRSTRFGDDTDRPVRKSDGSNTYFANDIAYHADKLARGFTTQINVWGADHGGYVSRMKAAVTAISNGAATLDIVLCQIVRVMKDGAALRMSKRAGTFVELRDLIEEVGPDAVRFIMLMRKSDAQMEFDLNAAVAQTRDNPIFYVQYAHARARSVLRAAAAPDPAAPLDSLNAPEEQALIRRLVAWPRLVEQAAAAREPHRIAFYLYDLAGDFHALWNAGREDAALRFLQADAPAATAARIVLVAATATVIRSGLTVLGVTPAEELR
jgi:arginyl-tRNA synthetase